MDQPTIYIWRHEFNTYEEFDFNRRMYLTRGFRVVAIYDGNQEMDIHEALKEIIRNHMADIQR